MNFLILLMAYSLQANATESFKIIGQDKGVDLYSGGYHRIDNIQLQTDNATLPIARRSSISPNEICGALGFNQNINGGSTYFLAKESFLISEDNSISKVQSLSYYEILCSEIKN